MSHMSDLDIITEQLAPIDNMVVYAMAHGFEFDPPPDWYAGLHPCHPWRLGGLPFIPPPDAEPIKDEQHLIRERLSETWPG